MRSIRKRLLLPAMFVFFAFMALVIFIGFRIYDHYYGMHRVDISDTAPALENEGDYNVVYGAEYVGTAITLDGDIYMEMDFINETWGSELYFYAKDVKKVLYTTQKEQLEYNVGNGDFVDVDGTLYIKASVATEVLGTQYTVNEEDRLIMVRRIEGTVGNIEQFRTYLRVTPDLNDHTYTVELDRNDTVEVYGQENGFYFVESQQGYMGYVQADRLTTHEETLSYKEEEIYEQDSDTLFSHTISMAFMQLMDNGLDEDGDVSYDVEYEVDNTWYYLNGLAPTMFSLSDDGTLISNLTPEYVEWARDEFYDVWVVFSNDCDDELTYATLSDTNKRQALVQACLSEIERCDADGLNIDFENISEETYPYFIQFLRELSYTIRTEWYCLSIDTPVPSEWTSYYRLDIYNDICDYVVLMAYDEYYGGSENAGPVSSQNFTMTAIYNTLKKVDKSKLVLGMPWYTRVWYGEDGALVDSEACSLDYASSIIDTYGLEKSYDASTGMNYYDGYNDDGVRIRIWMEDETSVEWRLKMAFDSELAGVIAWRIGLQNWTIWQPYEDLLIGNNF